MSKITLNSIADLTQSSTAQTTINTNSSTIQTAFDNTLSRDGTSPNQMGAALDMNSNQIINLPAPSTVNSPARLIDVTSNPTIVIPGTGTSGHVVPFLDGNNTWSGTETFNGAVTFGSTVSGLPISGWTNTRLAKTANYTVLSTDAGSTIALSGGFFTLTYGVASGYAANFASVIVNEDGGRGKTIAVNGYTNFILWPGQVITVFNDNNVWRIAGQARWILPSAVTLFVDSALGNDVNDGLAAGSGNAMKTLFQAVVRTAGAQFDLNASQAVAVTVQLADGTYTSGLHYPCLMVGGGGNQMITVQGNAISPGNVIVTDTDNVNSGIAIALFDGARISIKNLQMQGGGVANDCGLFVQTGAIARLSNVIFGTCAGGSHMQISSGAQVVSDGNYSISGNALDHVLTGTAGQFSLGSGNTVTVTNNLAFTTFAAANSLGQQIWGNNTIALGGHTVTGQRYNADGLGLIDTFGGGANFLPGNSAGAVSNNGVYA